MGLADEYARQIIKIANEECDNYIINEYNAMLFNSLFCWIQCKNFSSLDPFTRGKKSGDLNKGFYVAGRTGSGKTLAMKIFSKFCDANELKINNCCMAPCIMEAKKIVRNYIQHGDISLKIPKYCLCIDDMGAEENQAVHMGNKLNVLDELICDRYSRRFGFLFITSNLPLGCDEFADRYGDRLQSRLIQMCNYFEFRNEDYRVKK